METEYQWKQVPSKALESLKRQKFNQVEDFSNPKRHQYGVDAKGLLWMTNPVRTFGKK